MLRFQYRLQKTGRIIPNESLLIFQQQHLSLIQYSFSGGGILMSKLKSIPPPSLRVVQSVGFSKSTAKISSISSIVGGLQVMELIKFLQCKPVDQMRAFSIDLSCSLWKSSSPPPPRITINPLEVPERFHRFSEWDYLEIRGQPDMTVRQLQEFLVPLPCSSIQFFSSMFWWRDWRS